MIFSVVMTLALAGAQPQGAAETNASVTPLQPGAIQCVSGKVTSLTYGGYVLNSRDPWMEVGYGSTKVFIGLSANNEKARAAFADMRSLLQTALLSGVNTEVWADKGDCQGLTENRTSLSLAVL